MSDDPFNAREAADAGWGKQGGGATQTPNGRDDEPELQVEDAGDIDAEPIEPREWVFGNRYCLGFVSGNIGDGGVGKTALAIVDGVSISSGKPLTGEHLFRSERVLIVCLEDQRKEIRRRIKAALLHHKIDPSQVKGRLFFCAHKGEKIMVRNQYGQLTLGRLDTMIRAAIKRYQTPVIIVEPLIKAHSVDENNNVDMDAVIDAFVAIVEQENVSILITQHTRKGINTAGNPDMGRGATAVKNGARLVYTTVAMNDKEQSLFGLDELQAKSLIRVDSGKVNICRPQLATWFKLVGVPIGNATAMYPSGDEVQTVEVWTPPDIFAGAPTEALNKILDQIDHGFEDGTRYSDAPAAKKRAAWRVVTEHLPEKNEKQARSMIATWVSNEVLRSKDYEDPVRRTIVKGLFVNPAKRPGNEKFF